MNVDKYRILVLLSQGVKEREYQFKEQEWVSLQFQYMLMS